MRPSAGNGRYPQTAKCSRSVPEKNCIPLCSRTVIIAEARLRIPKQNIVRIAESIVLLWQKDDRFLYIVGLCRNPCTGLSMQTGGDMPVFWRRKPCSAGKTGCGKKDRSNRSVPMYSKKNGIADIIRLRFLAGHCQKNGYSVYSASDDPGERYTATERTEWQRKRK